MRPEHVAFFRAAFLRHAPRRYAVMQAQTADRKYDDFPGELSDRQIRDHLEGRAAYAVPYAEAGLGSVLAFDIDAGGLAAATALLDAAQARSLWAFGQVDTERGRGYVWVPFTSLTNIERLRLLGDQLLTEASGNGWKIENRASEADTRLPFARHRWSGRRGLLALQSGQLADLDQNERLSGILDRFIARYQENPTDTLPPPPTPRERAHERPTEPQGQGVTIASYNARTDLVQLLEHYGAKRAKGYGARLYFCPFHGDDHASLLVNRDGTTCRCMSAGSGCSLSGHQNDPFNVFCAGEQLTPQQALRRLNGLPENPGPGSGTSGRQTPRQRPTEPPRSSGEGKEASTPPEPPQNVSQGLPRGTDDLPKSARRVLDYLRRQPGDYCRGKTHLAEALDIDPRTVQRSLRRLEMDGHLTRYQRGRDGQTDIYRLAPCLVSYDTQEQQNAQTKGGATNRVAEDEAPEPAPILDPEEGRQMPPTLEPESLPATESYEAGRGGNSPEPRLDPETGAYHGPYGAFVVPGGAAWVPPEARDWYELLPPEIRGECPRQVAPEPEPLQVALAEEPAVPRPEPPARKRRATRAPAYVDPGRLQGRIIAAERKAAKLEAEGTAKARAQARAILREVERLKVRVALREEGYYNAEECDRWHAERQAAEVADVPPAIPEARGLIERLRGRLTPGQAPVRASAIPGG